MSRHGARPPDFWQTLRESKEKQARRQEAIDAARARSSGKSRQEIRQLIIDEMNSRAFPLPPPPVLDYLVESIALSGSPSRSVRMVPHTARLLSAFGGEIGTILDIFRGAQRLRDPSGRDPYFASPGQAPAVVDVVLDAGAEQVLDAWPGPKERTADVPRLVPVWLTAASEEGELVTVHVEQHRVGVLSRDDGRLLEDVLKDARRKNQTLMMLGAYSRRPPAGSPSLRIYPTGPEYR